MRLFDITIPNNYDLVLEGDEHWGNPTVNSGGVRDMLAWIAEKPKARGYLSLGDGIEATMTDHQYYRHDPDADPIPLQQADQFIQAHAETAAQGQLHMLLGGNHDVGRLHRFGNLVRDVMARQLSVPYGGQTAKVRLQTRRGRQICKIYVQHPDRCSISSACDDEIRRQANMQLALKRRLKRMASDCLIMAVAHTHKLLVAEPSQELLMTDDGRRVRQEYRRAGNGAAKFIPPDSRWYCATGSFLKTQEIGKDSYGERGMYNPIEMGFIVVKIRKGYVDTVEKVVI